MFICFYFYSSAGSIQTFPGDKRGRVEDSSVFSKEEERKNHAALVSLLTSLLLF